MLLDLSNSIQLNKFKTRCEFLIKKGSKVELTEKFGKRSTDQNSYFHAIITIFACDYGETLDYVKQEIFKRQVNPETFVFERINRITGETREALKSSSELTTQEMNTAIERFLNYSSSVGIYIMTADEYKENRWAVEQMREENRMYL